MEKLKIIVDDKGNTHVWMNGEKVEGIRNISFFAEAGETPEHSITFYTPYTDYPIKPKENET